jgi:surface protein
MILATHGIVGSQIVQFVPTFEFSVKTDNAGVSTSTQFRIPLTTSTGLDFDVDWGDGSAIENITNHTLAIHDYGTAGTYTISVTGSILGLQFNNGGDRLKILNINSWGALNISVEASFRGCTNLTATAIDRPKITTTTLFLTFANCSSFNGNISNWDVSNVSTFSSMFNGASIFNQQIGLWNVSNSTNMTDMLNNADAFNQDISQWDIKKVASFIRFLQNTPGLSTTNYDLLLVAWESQVPKTGINISFGGSKYTLLSAAATARASLIATYGWTITDGGGI